MVDGTNRKPGKALTSGPLPSQFFTHHLHKSPHQRSRSLHVKLQIFHFLPSRYFSDSWKGRQECNYGKDQKNPISTQLQHSFSKSPLVSLDLQGWGRSMNDHSPVSPPPPIPTTTTKTETAKDPREIARNYQLELCEEKNDGTEAKTAMVKDPRKIARNSQLELREENIEDAPPPPTMTTTTAVAKDPRKIARKYQLELCEKAVKENIIVYLGTGCGKTHIAVLLMYELRHLFTKPKKDVCIFLAPTVPLVRQQALVIENSTDLKVQSYYGDSKHLKSHDDWEKEVQQHEVLIMTPQIFLRNLRHCLVRSDLVALLIFDECHHAQLDKRHAYTQIMKEFFNIDGPRCPRIFGMTASPIIGRGGSKPSEHAKCINSLESILCAKVYGVDGNSELEIIAASPEINLYFYGPDKIDDSKIRSICLGRLEDIMNTSMSMLQNKISDLKDLKKKRKLLWKIHDDLVFSLEKVGLWGALEAGRILMPNSVENSVETDDAVQYLKKALSVLSCNFLSDTSDTDAFPIKALEEPFLSKKILALIAILQKYRERPNIKCIIFAKRIITVKTLAIIVKNLELLEFWKCEFLVGYHSGSITRCGMNTILEKFRCGEVNLLFATNVAEEGLDIPTCSLVIRFDLPETVASFIQSRGRARMSKSEYVFLVERGNQREENIIDEFKWKEKVMNKEIMHRTSTEIFDSVEEATYKVEATGASISTGCSVMLLHHYCSKLPRIYRMGVHDRGFLCPAPQFFYIEDSEGTICRVVLPTNSPVRQVHSSPCCSKDEAKRSACLTACIELQKQGALNDYLLPEADGDEKNQEAANSVSEHNQHDELREEVHGMHTPEALKATMSKFENPVMLYFYLIKFTPLPKDRKYRKFGLFLKHPLPKEAETMEVDLHLAHGRVVKVALVPSGTISFSEEEIVLAWKFQAMSLKIVLDRLDFDSSFVPLEMPEYSGPMPSLFYLMLPIFGDEYTANMDVDWKTINICLSSPIFSVPENSASRVSLINDSSETLVLASGPAYKRDILNSLVFSPHRKVFYFIDEILYDTSGYSKMKGSKNTSYFEFHKNKHSFELLHPEQPLLKAKQLFCPRNLLHNRLQDNTEVREHKEHFVQLVPERCFLKIIGFSKDIGSSLSLLPSFMHRLENLLLAIQLKDVLSTSLPECSRITSYSVLKALTTERGLERFSLERLEVLGDAFLKYAVSRCSFLSFKVLDEGQLTSRRSGIVNNLHLYELAIRKKLQFYICDEMFEPNNFSAPGRPCRIVCNHDMHSHVENGSIADVQKSPSVKCNNGHRLLHKKTIADVVEALVGAFLVDCGFKAASAFLQWIGIEVAYQFGDIQKICDESKNNINLINKIDIAAIEKLLGYRFLHKGLLLQAFIHPSYTQHCGGSYQRLEFLGDAVLDYLITSYLYSSYPDLTPGHLTDLRSITISNDSFGRLAVQKMFHEHLIKDSKSLTEAIKAFEERLTNDPEMDQIDEVACPKVLGDIIESCFGAVLLDSGFDLNRVWKIFLNLLEPSLGLTSIYINPIRELQELCQFLGFSLIFPKAVMENGEFLVDVAVHSKSKDINLICSARNSNTKVARRIASGEMLSALKARNFKQKTKSLAEVLVKTRKQKTELIGYDEIPVVLQVDNLRLDMLKVSDTEEVSVHPCCSGVHENPEVLMFSGENQASIEENSQTGNCKQKDVVTNVAETCSTSGSCNNDPSIKDSAFEVSAKSWLFEVCAINYWNPPSFACYKEEGPNHLKKYAYKVTVEVPLSGEIIILECFGEAREKKKAAQEHAAEGATWYLKQLGSFRT